MFTCVGWIKVELCESGPQSQGAVSHFEFSPLNHWLKQGKEALMRHLWYRVRQPWESRECTALLSWSETHSWLTVAASAPPIHVAFSLRPHYLQALSCRELNLVGLLSQAHCNNTWHTSSGGLWLKNASLARSNPSWNCTSVWNSLLNLLFPLFLLVFRESIYYLLKYPPLLLLLSSSFSKSIPSSTSFVFLISFWVLFLRRCKVIQVILRGVQEWR